MTSSKSPSSMGPPPKPDLSLQFAKVSEDSTFEFSRPHLNAQTKGISTRCPLNLEDGKKEMTTLFMNMGSPDLVKRFTEPQLVLQTRKHDRVSPKVGRGKSEDTSRGRCSTNYENEVSHLCVLRTQCVLFLAALHEGSLRFILSTRKCAAAATSKATTVSAWSHRFSMTDVNVRTRASTATSAKLHFRVKSC